MLDAWRERGEPRVNRMRFRVIEALARRASQHQGDTRRVIDARLSELLDAQELADARDAAPEPSARSPLAGLLDEMSQRAEARPAPSELLDALRSVWSTVSAEKRLRESLAQVPKNAGPLNSSSLVHRSLSLMREVSPDYLQHFLGYVDALSWLEELTLASGAANKDAPRPGAAKKTARGKAR
ncbi:hypothetical protein AWB83_03001 [Caballeronia ptereochthonis]|uniref:DUF2894 domain-containing protein n=2 Tax=Caballeronia ptereochthonis TaxID=1777144 RepID=A0A158B9P3_9BURK|nr:hypothetical protein AWB83_03001 [Caballeronia ptereochthonis]